MSKNKYKRITHHEVEEGKKARKKRLREWKEFLKKDADWDYEFILHVLSYKLRRTRECFAKHALVKGKKKMCRQMAKAERLLIKVIKDNYFEKKYKPLEKKYGPMCDFTPDGIVWNNNPDIGQEDYFDKIREIGDESEAERDRDLRKAMKILSKNMFTWWY